MTNHRRPLRLPSLLLAAALGLAPASAGADPLGLALPAHAGGGPGEPSRDRLAAETEITGAVEMYFWGIDLRDFDLVRDFLADGVRVDDGILGGHEGNATPDDPLGAWEATLPGFDRTLHHPHRFSLRVKGDHASATCEAIAVHVLDGEAWAVHAGYDFEFARTEAGWKIDRLRLPPLDEHGDRGLLARAARRVEAGQTPPEPFAMRSEAVEGFFAAIEAGDLDAVVASFAEDATQAMPFASADAPATLSGHEAIRSAYGPAPAAPGGSRPLALFATGDPDLVLAAYDGDTTGRGAEADIACVGLFRLNAAGRIQHFTEFFAPAGLPRGGVASP